MYTRICAVYTAYAVLFRISIKSLAAAAGRSTTSTRPHEHITDDHVYTNTTLYLLLYIVVRPSVRPSAPRLIDTGFPSRPVERKHTAARPVAPVLLLFARARPRSRRPLINNNNNDE